MQRFCTNFSLLAAVLGAASFSCQNGQVEAEQAQHGTSTNFSALDPCAPVSVEPSLVVRTQSIIGAADFSFLRTIQNIRNTSGGAATTDAALAQTITSGLLTNPFSQPVSALPIPAMVRTAENGLSGAGLLTQMQPIALFNRFDLAPIDGSNCGEYRIVYGRYPNAVLDRYLLIFEAVLPNPAPASGLAGCQPVQQFWHDLADPALTDAARAAQLANFYYVGLPGFEPVVHFDHYGAPLGQVRANMFRMQPWQLREWRTTFNGTGQPVFTPDTDKDNPLAEFYNEGSSNPNPALFASEQNAFRTDFVGPRMARLTLAEHDAFNNGTPIPTGCNLVNTIGAGFPNRFNEFQGNSQFPGGGQPADEPNVVASLAFRNAVTTALTGDPAVAGLNDTHVLNRAGAVTCGGCHQFSVGKLIGPGTAWPGVATNGFVHVREEGAAPPATTELSPALLNCFLPGRQAIMQAFLCSSSVPDAGQPDAAGPDASAPDAGGQACDLYNPCSQYEYCEFGPYNVCGSSGPGVCMPRPAGCGYGFEVCGCDGQTYQSECLANQAGTDVASQGACPGSCTGPTPLNCCFSDNDCAKKGGHCVGEICAQGQAGVCKGPPSTRGGCWEDSDCGLGEMCDGERVCPCGFNCILPDAEGQCVKSGKRSVADRKVALFNSLSSQSSAGAAQALQEFEAAVQEAREEHRLKAGAFVRERRTH